MWDQLPDAAMQFARANLAYPLPVLREIEEQARQHKIPIVPPEVAAFLYTLVRLTRPKKVLEIGSGAAFSTLWMASALKKDGRLFALDRDKNRSVISAANISRAGLTDIVTIRQLDAISPEGRAAIEAEGPYDLVFIDCEKRIYPSVWKHCADLVSANGLIVADNVLFRGLVDGDYTGRHNAHGVEALREFIELAKGDTRFVSQILPLGDGVLVAIKEDTHG